MLATYNLQRSRYVPTDTIIITSSCVHVSLLCRCLLPNTDVWFHKTLSGIIINLKLGDISSIDSLYIYPNTLISIHRSIFFLFLSCVELNDVYVKTQQYIIIRYSLNKKVLLYTEIKVPTSYTFRHYE